MDIIILKNLRKYFNSKKKLQSNTLLFQLPNNKKHLIFLILLIITFLLFSIASYTKAVSNDLSSSLFRLHVIAASYSEEDQQLKYKVRDKLIEYMNLLTSNLSSKDEVIAIAKNNIDNFEEIARNVIKENGFNYDVNVEIGNFNFPTKTYGDIKLPAGFYDALRIKIGDAKGQNWWCVMFPPLCFVDVTSGVVPDDSKENLKENLSDEDYSLISQDNDTTEFKFKLVELFNNLAIKLANK